MITGPKTREILLNEFLSFKPNTRQRKTEERAKRVLKEHLRKSEVTHFKVAAVRWNGSIYVVDGHTRRDLWEDGRLSLPCNRPLSLDEYECDLYWEIGYLYDLFDSPWAVKNARDRLHGIAAEQGIPLVSDLMRRGGASTALSLLCGAFGKKLNMSNAVTEWKIELAEIDSWDLARNQLPSMVLAAAMACVRGYGLMVRAFFLDFAHGKGNCEEGMSDGIDALIRLMARRKASKSNTGRDNLFDIAGKVVSCIKAWIEGRRFSAGVKGVDWHLFVGQIRSGKFKCKSNR